MIACPALLFPNRACMLCHMKRSLRRLFVPCVANPAKLLVSTAIFAWTAPLDAQPAQTPVPTAAQTETRQLNPEELGQLLSPIALYPDALIAIILPASTVPSDVVLGARYLAANGNPDLAGRQSWDDSVKSLVRYPEVLAWLDKNLEWTASLGEAFVEQPADVMNAIQSLRQQARAAGNLKDMEQQKVVVEEKIIRIVPADPQVIYVPQYNPEVVYVQSYGPDPLLTFGIGFAVGAWLNCDFDWNRHRFYRGSWQGWDHGRNNGWNGHQGGNQINVVTINNPSVWQPSPSGHRQISQRQRNNNGNARYVSARASAPQQQAVARFNPGAQTALPRPSRIELPASGKETARSQTAHPAKAIAHPPVNPAVPDASAARPEGTPGRSAVRHGQNSNATTIPPAADAGRAEARASQPGAEIPHAAPASKHPSRLSAVPSATPKVNAQPGTPSRNSSKEATPRSESFAAPAPVSGNTRKTVSPSAPVPLPAPQTERHTGKPIQPRSTEGAAESHSNKAPAARQNAQTIVPAPEIRQQRQQPQPRLQPAAEIRQRTETAAPPSLPKHSDAPSKPQPVANPPAKASGPHAAVPTSGKKKNDDKNEENK